MVDDLYIFIIQGEGARCGSAGGSSNDDDPAESCEDLTPLQLQVLTSFVLSSAVSDGCEQWFSEGTHLNPSS